MKAQGLPLNTIVLGALAILVLVLLAAAFVPGMGNIFGSLLGVAGSTTEQFISSCQTSCQNLDYRYSTQTAANTAIQASVFCTSTDDSGKRCYGTTTGVGLTCIVHLTNGTSTTISTSCTGLTWT